jgi:hypothetical protein
MLKRLFFCEVQVFSIAVSTSECYRSRPQSKISSEHWVVMCRHPLPDPLSTRLLTRLFFPKTEQHSISACPFFSQEESNKDKGIRGSALHISFAREWWRFPVHTSNFVKAAASFSMSCFESSLGKLNARETIIRGCRFSKSWPRSSAVCTQSISWKGGDVQKGAYSFSILCFEIRFVPPHLSETQQTFK